MFLRRPLAALAGALMVSLLAAPAAGQAPADTFDPAAVDRFVSDYVDRHGLPGAAVAVVEDGQLVHEAGYGEDSEGEPLTEHTRLHVASLTKSVTAFAVLQLVDDGQVGLDEPVTSYLPELQLDDERVDEVTVRQLLSHTSGIVTPTVIPPARTLREGVARTHDWALASEPGTDYAYSNANYWIAARLVEVVSGQSFPDYLRSEVFEPLGMDDSLSTITSDDVVPGVVRGHVTAYGLALPAPEPAQMDGGAGSVVSTAHDMARWLAMQQRAGVTPDGERLLSAGLVEESHQAQPGAPRSGLGWELSGPGVEPARLGHSGVAATFQAQQDLVPSSGHGVVVMLNSFTIWREHAYAISAGIIEITQGGDPEVGTPVPTLVDLGLLVVTSGVLVLGFLGVRHAPRWARRRAARPRWRMVPRMLPHLLAPCLAVLLWVVSPRLQDNSLTSADVFRLAPAAMVLLLAATLAELALVAGRMLALRRPPS